jgi:ribosomal protein S18 acetylase RimI-like enzyme
MSTVRRLADGEAPALAAIVRGLPEYFTDDVPGKVENDAADREARVITADGTIAGFVIAARKSPGGAEILWIAVDAPRCGQGHGTRLLTSVMDDLAAAGVSIVTVKTLDNSAGYAPYEATRAFYERNGFVYIDTIDPLPGWAPGNPAAIYAAAIRPTLPPRP